MKITYTPSAEKSGDLRLIPSVLITSLISVWMVSVGIMWDPSVLSHGIQISTSRSK